MTNSDIEHMAQGYPPSYIGKDHEEVVIELASSVIELQQKLDAMAAENAALKEFGDKLNDMHNNLNGEGTGIQGRAEVACQQAALEAAIEEFDTIKTPATDTYLNSVRAESWADALIMVKSAIFTDSIDHIDFLFNGKIEQLRSGTHDTADKAG